MSYDDGSEYRQRTLGPSRERTVQRIAPKLQRITPPDPDRLSDGAVEAETGQESSKEDDQGPRSILWEITETLVLALLIFLIVRTVVLNFRVDGLSMEPSLDSGQMLLVNRQIYLHFDANHLLDSLPFVERDGDNVVYPFHPPQRGAIIVFNPPIAHAEQPYIKRVVGLPGEHLSIHSGGVYIDGERLSEDYIGGARTSWPGRPNDFTFTIPDGYVFVMGDNRNNSTDSRTFGPVPIDSIIGKAWVSYWPTGHLGIFSAPQYLP